MKIETLNIFNVKMNSDNPRTFKKSDVDNIVKSLIVFPEMLKDIRSIAVKDNIVLGGNLRLRGLRSIASMPINDIADLIAKHSQDKSEERVKYLIDFWSDFQTTKTFPFINADDLTDNQAKEFIIKDNVNLGAWDIDMLANEWDSDLLNDWNLDVWNEPNKSSTLDNPKPAVLKIEFQDNSNIDPFIEDVQNYINKYNAKYTVK